LSGDATGRGAIGLINIDQTYRSNSELRFGKWIGMIQKSDREFQAEKDPLRAFHIEDFRP
jgi:hypothetical protein